VDVREAGRDVTVLLPVHKRHDAAITVLPYAAGDGDDFALITISLPDTRQQSMPRDVTFVVDVSGSMSGGKLDQARAAGKRLLETLGANDRFRIIDFSSDVRSFRDGFVNATRGQIQAADRYLDALEANGSTNIEGALRSALGGADTGTDTGADTGADTGTDTGTDTGAESDSVVRRPTGRMGVVLFLTDGAPTVGERDPMALAALASRLRGARRLFTFGVGADVNASLIEQLALQGRGTASFVRPDENLERAVSIVAERLRDPVVADVRVRATGGVHLSDMLPVQPVDIFAGQDLVLLARYSGSGAARVDVDGQTNAGPITWSTTVNFPDRDRENAFVPRLWATQRIGWLSAEKRKAVADGGSTSEIDREIRELGERWGIPTEFSSYLVREPNVAMVPVGVRPVPQ
ncbi:MAG: VWA domain-containing protein, partial [Gemmatimonadaceae bacterium]